MFSAIWRALHYHPGPGPTPPRPGASQQEQETFEAARKEYYNTYLTPGGAWTDTRNGALWRAGYKCQRCGRRKGDVGADGEPIRWLEVHHLNYKNFGYEAPGDLKVVCKPCHEIEDEIRRNKNRRRR